MPTVSWEQFGVVGLAFTFILALAKMIPTIIRATKEAGRGKKDVALDNNTKAITELNKTQTELFNLLKTQAAVNDEKEQHRDKKLDIIEDKLDKISEQQSRHIVQCETTCMKVRG